MYLSYLKLMKHSLECQDILKVALQKHGILYQIKATGANGFE